MKMAKMTVPMSKLAKKNTLQAFCRVKMNDYERQEELG